MRRAALLALPLALLGCENLSGHLTAENALKAFCAANDSELFSFLVTPEQKHAATILCRLMGWSLGTPAPIADPMAGKPLKG